MIQTALNRANNFREASEIRARLPRHRPDERSGDSTCSQIAQCPYQWECGDHRLQRRHCVSVHWSKQAGHTPPVSNVFHSKPQVQNHLSCLRGDQSQSGQRMRGGSDSPGLFSSSSWRLGIVTGFSVSGLMPAPISPRSQHEECFGFPLQCRLCE